MLALLFRLLGCRQTLLREFLYQNHLAAPLADLVRATNPLPRPMPQPGAPGSVADADRIIRQMERDGQGVPVLLRQYLKLGARVLGFSLDPSFGNGVDALMMVDLTAIDPAILNRYLGRAEAIRFLARHGGKASPTAA